MPRRYREGSFGHTGREAKAAGRAEESAEERDEMNCDDCAYYEYDEEEEAYFCSVDMDEDDYARVLGSHYRNCPFYRNGDEYRVVRHQM